MTANEAGNEFTSRLAVRDAIVAARAVQERAFQAWLAASPDSNEQESARVDYVAANDDVNRLLSLYRQYEGR